MLVGESNMYDALWLHSLVGILHLGCRFPYDRFPVLFKYHLLWTLGGLSKTRFQIVWYFVIPWVLIDKQSSAEPVQLNISHLVSQYFRPITSVIQIHVNAICRMAIIFLMYLRLFSSLTKLIKVKHAFPVHPSFSIHLHEVYDFINIYSVIGGCVCFYL